MLCEGPVYRLFQGFPFPPHDVSKKTRLQSGAQEGDLESLSLRGHGQTTFSLQGAQPVGRGFWEHRVLTWP